MTHSPRSRLSLLPTLTLAGLVILAGCSGGGGGSSSAINTGGSTTPATGSGNGTSAGGLQEREPNDTPANALDLGGSVTNSLQGSISRTAAGPVLAAGDLDLVRLTAPFSGQLSARLEMPPGSDFDLALLDAGGRRLATSRSDNLSGGIGAVEHLLVTLTSSRVYHLEVSGFAGAPGSYRLALQLTPDPLAGAVQPAASLTEVVGPLTRPRSFHAAAALPTGGALVAGGTADPSSTFRAALSATSSCDLYDPSTRSFVAGPTMAATRFGLTATTLPSGRVLLTGGDLGGSAELFDPHAGNAFVAGSLAVGGGMRVMHTASLLPDGRVVIAGGTTVTISFPPVSSNLADSAVFDPKTRRFTVGPALRTPRSSHAAVTLADGRVLLVGGEGRADTEIVDLSTGTSLPGPALTTTRDDHTATRLADGRVLVTGGQTGGRSQATAEILDDPSAGAGSQFRLLTATLSERRADHQAIALPNGQVLLLGGEDDPANGTPDAILRGVDLFDPSSEAFTTMPALAVPRDDHRTVRLANGQILVTGGEDVTSRSISAVETYLVR